MDESRRLLFFIGEHLPSDGCEEILRAREHAFRVAKVGQTDDSILLAAEAAGGIVLTADRWYLAELYRFPIGHKNTYAEAGVVQLPGEWERARTRLLDYLPLVEWAYQLRQRQADHRVGMDLSQRSTIRIVDAEQA